jgi:hypothetical protein
MKLKAFTALARKIFEKLPEEWRTGLGELTIVRRARHHPVIVSGYLLAEPVPAKGDAPAEFRLYYGSFVALDSRDPDFDFEHELREALAYEALMRSIAGSVPSAQHASYALRENAKRLNGDPFDPLLYRFGAVEGRATFSIGNTVFLELPLSNRQLQKLAGRSLRVRVHGMTHFVRVPRTLPEPRFRRLGRGPNGREIWAVMLGLHQLAPDHHSSAR